MSGDVNNGPGPCEYGDVNNNREDEEEEVAEEAEEGSIVIDIDSEQPCSSQNETICHDDEDTDTPCTSEEEYVTKKETNKKIDRHKVDIHLEDVLNTIGTSNLAYSSESIDSLPVILDLNENCRYRYSVVIDSLNNDGVDGMDYSDALAGPSTSTSSLEFNLRAVQLERTCSCNCHRREHSAPSYDELFSSDSKNNKRDSLKVTIDHDDETCQGTSCPSYQKRKKRFIDNNLIINLGSVRNSPTITPGNTPGRLRRILPSQMVKMLNSRGNSPVSDKAPPNYRSLIFSILQDEPPKYEDVTGKKLADELIWNAQNNRQQATIGQRLVQLALKRRFIGIVMFLTVLALIVIFLYLSAEISREPREHMRVRKLKTTPKSKL